MARAQAQPPGPLRGGGQEGEGGRQAPAAILEVMLRHPGHVKAQLVGGDEQFECLGVNPARVAGAFVVGHKAQAECARAERGSRHRNVAAFWSKDLS